MNSLTNICIYKVESVDVEQGKLHHESNDKRGIWTYKFANEFIETQQMRQETYMIDLAGDKWEDGFNK